MGLHVSRKAQNGALFSPGEGELQLKNTGEVDPVRLLPLENRLDDIRGQERQLEKPADVFLVAAHLPGQV